ncbi:MAG: DUF6029 family protein [Ignavibacteria bacterium]|nr:DUF6029 family protein [Ignavibacteria bacterium]
MKKASLFFFALFELIILSFPIKSQSLLENLQIGGNFQSDSYYYLPDSKIEAEQAPEKILSNNYLYLTFSTNYINVFFRFESYQNPILGFDPRYQGSGIAYRSVSYRNDFLGVTVGNFYEQFGSGMILRAYEERNLGIDNSIDGAKIEVNPTNGITLKGVIGKQRHFWSYSKAIIRGLDLETSLNSLFPNAFEKFPLILGGSLVSRYQPDMDSKYKLPENVLAFATRFDLSLDWFSINFEYAKKINDPTTRNKYTYNNGDGINLSLSTFTEGFSVLLNLHRYDNIEFRTDREAKGLELFLNYLPSATKQHQYSLPAFYSPSTQGNGEVGIQSEINYTLPKEITLFFGGKFETNIVAGFSLIKSIDTTRIDEFSYNSNFWGIGKELFYQDVFFEIRRRITKEFETKLAYIWQIYNKDVMENEGSPLYGKVKNHTLIGEFILSFDKRNTLRLELQHMWSKNDSTVAKEDKKNGNWLAILAEHSIAPNWYFSILDQWNYGNANDNFKTHYIKAIVTYIQKATRISFGFGRDAGGIVCIGGVCRQVPISYGFSLSITTSF